MGGDGAPNWLLLKGVGMMLPWKVEVLRVLFVCGASEGAPQMTSPEEFFGVAAAGFLQQYCNEEQGS
jgi:hypothetical protein